MKLLLIVLLLVSCGKDDSSAPVEESAEIALIPSPDVGHCSDTFNNVSVSFEVGTTGHTANISDYQGIAAMNYDSDYPENCEEADVIETSNVELFQFDVECGKTVYMRVCLRQKSVDRYTEGKTKKFTTPDPE